MTDSRSTVFQLEFLRTKEVNKLGRHVEHQYLHKILPVLPHCRGLQYSNKPAASEGLMLLRMLFQLIILTSSIAIANNEQKTVLPASVLKAHNVVVLVDPEAGISVTDPVANKKAQDDIEKAILKWGRFKPVSDVETADLVIVIRKGSGKTVQSTIGGLPTNDRPVPSIPIGGQKGHPPNVPQQEEDTRPHPQVEVGQSQDMFVVYEGHVTRPLERPPVWRYIAKNALHSPDVPAVGEFRKLIEGVEKQRNDKP